MRIGRWAIALLLFFSFPVTGILWPFLALLGAILMAPDVAGFFGERLTRTLTVPGRELEPAPLTSIAESLVQKAEYAKALEEYERIRAEFPADLKLNVDMIDVAIRRLHDPEMAAGFYARAQAALAEDAEAQAALTKMYDAVCSRLHERDPVERERITLHTFGRPRGPRRGRGPDRP